MSSYYEERDPSFGEEFTVSRAGILTAYHGHGAHVVVPDGVRQIARGAFTDNQTLERLELPALTHLCASALEDCKNLKEVVFRGPVWAVGTSAFEGCESLREAVLPAGTVHVANRAFYGCKQLRRVSFPADVASVSDAVFGNCPALEQIEMAQENAHYFVEGNCIIARENGRLVAGCARSTIAYGVRIIGSGAFASCENLQSIYIPASVIDIEGGAFWDCANITSIKVAEENPVYYAKGNCIIDKKTHTLIMGCSASAIPQGVKRIGGNAFLGCTALREISIPDGVEVIESYAFAYCTALKTVHMPKSVARVEPYAFGYYSSYNGDEGTAACFREEANWEGDVLYIGNHLIAAKADRVERLKVRLGATVGMQIFTEIDEGLQELDLSEAYHVADGAFEKCYAIKKIILPQRMEVRLGKIFNANYQKAEIILTEE